MIKKTKAVLYNNNGAIIGQVETFVRSGSVRYAYNKTIDGTLINLMIGRLSRSKKAFDDLDRKCQHLSITQVSTDFLVSE